MIYVDEDDPVDDDVVIEAVPIQKVIIRHGVNVKDIYDLQDEIGSCDFETTCKGYYSLTKDKPKGDQNFCIISIPNVNCGSNRTMFAMHKVQCLGKFGTVYSCTRKDTSDRFAAKFINIPRKEDRRCVEREIDIMRDLKHSRLIQLHDAFDNGKIMCLILELIEGGELFDRIVSDDFILTEKSCTAFMRQICQGIEFIHKANILHLDLKPENILCLTKTGNRIKIIDFGLARRYDASKKLQVLFGTPEFVAPEVVNFDEIAFGTDMWSVGVITYVLLSGLSPFMGDTDIETMANVTIAKYDFDDEAFNNISDAAKDFIRKLLTKDQNERMTASECLAHVWLQRTNQNMESGLNQAKDQLKTFVERWREHPNSPYLLDTNLVEGSDKIDDNSSTKVQASTSARSSFNFETEFGVEFREKTLIKPFETVLTWKQLSYKDGVPVNQKRFNERSRDVPLSGARSLSDAKDRTKDLLLYLLDKWNENVKLNESDANGQPSSPFPRHKSVTVYNWKEPNH